LTEKEIYKELVRLTKDKERWKDNITYVASLLDNDSEKIKAKALWMLGEMGLEYPNAVRTVVPPIASFGDSSEALLRERSVNALGRIGRGNYESVKQYWSDLFKFAKDENAKVRLSFIWASENIATNTPDVYENYMQVFEKLLYDTDDKVRMEAPEIFRVLGKRKPKLVKPYIERLRKISETDSNEVVRIHCKGAIRATERILMPGRIC
jgi:HEAT repeat protein